MIVDTGGLGWALRVMQAIASCCEVRPSKFFGNTPTGCTHRHYIHKTLGSVAHHFARAQEVIAKTVE